MFKSVLIGLIKLYQTFYPKKFRGKCIYKTSCSNFVLQETKEKGFINGVKALNYRFKNCKPGYRIIPLPNKKIILITRDNEVLEQNEISHFVLKTYYNQYQASKKQKIGK